MKKTNKAIALALAMLMLISSLMLSLSSCVKDNNTGDGGGNNDGGNNGNQSTASYSVTVVTKGGMALAKLPVYIHEYEDGAIGELVDNGYAATDENGKATFNLPEGEYAANISLSLPDGYDADAFYPLVSKDMTITVSSSVIPETSLVGVSYQIGSVMRDFTVNSKVLVENKDGDLVFKDEVFTLSETLKEKDAVLINFWYVNCSACQMEFPYMKSVYEEYSDDIAIIALDPLASDTIYDIDSFQSSYGLTFNVAQDLDGIANAFGVTAFPTSVMVDRYGVVTLIHVGAITGERPFGLMFDAFIGDNYQQKLVYDVNTLVPKEKPDKVQPDSSVIGDAFELEDLGDINYRNDVDDEYSWPFENGQIGEGDDAISVIYPTNSKKEASYAQLIFDIDLKVGDVLAFDYYSSTELGADYLYVVVNEKDIYSISGESNEWKTCYAFVAEEDATYEVALIYIKDSSEDVGDDTVYLKDLRVVTEEEIDSPTYIFRFAATNPDDFSNYQDFVDVFVGSDGYYHVDSETGPILLADLMGYTRFSEDNAIYYMAEDLYSQGKLTVAEYDKLIDYCSYASNSTLYGITSVTPELKELLDKIVYYFGDSANDKDWMRMCCYYDAYGTNGKQLEDPIKGLSLFSAYDVIESENGSTDFPNSFVYNRVIMPRGLLGKFTPTVSGTYLVTSNAYDEETDTYGECNAWIFTEDGYGRREPWLTYENVSRTNIYDVNNCYMIVYLEAGVDYYIDIAYYDVYSTGTIKYRVERLGGEGYYRFSNAAPGPFTALENPQGELTETITLGIDVVLGEDKIWREKRDDGRVGSILYADFTMSTPVFTTQTLEQIMKLGAFDFSRTEEDQYIINILAQFDGDVEKCDKYLHEEWDEDYDTYAEIYQLEDVYQGIYHGTGKDYTKVAEKYLDKIITVGYNADLGETIKAGDERIGCVIVTEELAELLQILMDKYTFKGVENSWRKLCYYHQYFCSETPK